MKGNFRSGWLLQSTPPDSSTRGATWPQNRIGVPTVVLSFVRHSNDYRRAAACKRASMRAAKEGSMEASRIVSKWFFHACPMCSIGSLRFFYMRSQWFAFCVPLSCLLFANVSLLFPNVFLLCISFSYELRTCILYGLSRLTVCYPLTSSPPALQSRACRVPVEPCLWSRTRSTCRAAGPAPEKPTSARHVASAYLGLGLPAAGLSESVAPRLSV